MAYRVEDLAASGGVSVDTVRYYQGLGLLPPPRRRGRVAEYEDAHLERLHRIRELADSGFTLRQIGELMEHPGSPDPLLSVLSGRRPAPPTLSVSELAEDTGIPEPVLRVAIDAGVLRPGIVDGAERFDEEQAAMVATVGRLIAVGIDLDRLIELAGAHVTHVESLVGEAVSLYAAALGPEAARDRERLAAEIDSLVPAITRMVSNHFERTLVEHVSAMAEGR